MLISRKRLERLEALADQLLDLRLRVKELEFGGRADFYNGKVSVNRTGKHRLEDAVNVLAEHVGVSFSVTPEVEPRLTVTVVPGQRRRVGKTDGR